VVEKIFKTYSALNFIGHSRWCVVFQNSVFSSDFIHLFIIGTSFSNSFNVRGPSNRLVTAVKEVKTSGFQEAIQLRWMVQEIEIVSHLTSPGMQFLIVTGARKCLTFDTFKQIY
jgi:hypothetical protein